MMGIRLRDEIAQPVLSDSLAERVGSLPTMEKIRRQHSFHLE